MVLQFLTRTSSGAGGEEANDAAEEYEEIRLTKKGVNHLIMAARQSTASEARPSEGKGH